MTHTVSCMETGNGGSTLQFTFNLIVQHLRMAPASKGVLLKLQLLLSILFNFIIITG